MKNRSKPAAVSTLEAVRQALARAAPRGEGMLVACSGGLDSVCLLRLLVEAGAAVGGPIEIAHVDHGLREGSADDARFCRALAEELGLPFHLGRLDPGDLAGGRGVQAEARELRRRFLEETRARRGLGAMALGHHADDQVETVLFRLLRGTGPRGLAGMAEWDPPLLRPLLRVRRADLEALARSRGWAHREDPTNDTDRYARNRLRRRALPALRAVHPGVDGAVLRLARLAREDDACLSELARSAFGRAAVAEPEGLRFPAGALTGLPVALRRRVYLAAWEALGGDPGVLEARHLEDVESLLGEGRAHRRAPIPGPLAVAASYGALWFLRPGALAPRPLEVRLVRPEDDRGAGPRWTLSRPEGLPCVGVPSGRGIAGVTTRTWRPGDRLPSGEGGQVKVKDLLMEARLPRWRRARGLVVEDREGALGLRAPGRAWGGEDGTRGWVWFRAEEGAESPHLAEFPPENGCCLSKQYDT